jgi:hypothetical protein
MENLEPACKRVAGVRFMTNVVTPLFDTTFKMAVRPHQPHIQWSPGFIPPGKKNLRF